MSKDRLGELGSAPVNLEQQPILRFVDKPSATESQQSEVS